LFYSGLFALHTRSALSLAAILEDYFGVAVEVEQFVGRWYPLAAQDQCCFDRGQTLSEQLGVGVVAGDEIWDQQAGVRIRLGPLTMEQYKDFLPQGTAWKPLRAITRFFSGDEIDYEVQLVLRRDEVPPCELSETPAGGTAAQLGWTTWVKTAPVLRDPGDTILKLTEVMS
jgi:type VI secretion system protein ImpH